MKYLLDTNVVCESTAKQPDAATVDWMDKHAHESFLSSVSLGEIWKGLHRLPEGKRKRSLIAWANGLEQDFSDILIGLNVSTLKIWGELYAKHEARGCQLDVMDSLIAAQAVEHELVVVTRKTSGFPPDVKTFNPWVS
jgi:toxin FitB